MILDLVQRLRDRVEELERLLGVSPEDCDRYRALGLAPTPRRVLGHIVKRQIATREGLYAALHGNRPESEQPDIRVLDQQMWRVRKALKLHGITIKTEWGIGYSMSVADKAKLRLLVSS